MPILQLVTDGDLMTGPEVKALQEALLAKGFPPGDIDGIFGHGTDAALQAFQHSEGLLVDGKAGPRTLAALDLAPSAELPSVVAQITPLVVSRMLPYAPLGNIKANLGPLLEALTHFGIADRVMVLMALATIAAESGLFLPVDEGISRFNTSPNGHSFDLYDKRKILGNQGEPDGARFKGRGFIQLTGRYNYASYGQRLGIDLLNDPEQANQPYTAGLILACFLKDKERVIKEAIQARDFKTARKAVNGGIFGLDHFQTAYEAGEKLIK